MSDSPSSEPGGRRGEPGKAESVRLEDLKAFLRAHPRALDDDKELVSLLTPPAYHSGHNVLDMQSFMISRLKSQAVERAAREVKIKKALVADTLEERRLQKAVLSVTGSRGFEQLIDTITRQLPQTLAASRIALNIERPDSGGAEFRFARPGPTGPIRIIPSGAVERLFGRDEARSGTMLLGEAPVFSSEGSPIRSWAAVRLAFGTSAPPGLLAIGAKSAQRFGRGIALHRYVFLARIIEQSIRLWLDLPPG